MPESPRPGFTPRAPSGSRRLWAALTSRPRVGQIGIGVLVALLAFGAVQQVRAEDDALLGRARRADLVQILDGLTTRGDRLEDQISELESTRRDLASGVDSEQTAREQAESRLRQLEVLAGVEPATGPGVQVTVTDPTGGVQARTMITGVQELRDANTEAMQVAGDDGTTVRIVASTYFLPADGGISVSGQVLSPPYTITAIGDPETLASAVAFVEGFADQVSADGGETTVTQFDELVVDAVHEEEPPEYAQPAPVDAGAP